MQYTSRVERVDSLTRRKAPWRPSAIVTPTYRCLGAAIEEWQHEPGEAPEGFLLDHLLSVQVGLPLEAWFRWGGKAWRKERIGTHQSLLLSAGVPYAARWTSPTRSIVVSMSPSFVRSVAGGSSRDPFDLKRNLLVEDPFITHLVLALRAEARRHSARDPLYGESLMMALTAHLIRHYGNRPGALRNDDTSGASMALQLRDRSNLRETFNYIDDKLSCSLHLSELADIAGLDVYQFVRSFKNATGLPPHQYILRRRIERGKSLLRQSRLPVTTIAQRCGFTTPSHFTNAFRRMTRLTPTAYRRFAADGR